MKAAVDPKDTSRASAFAYWMKAPNPMVTFFRTFDVTHLVRVSFQFRHTQIDGAQAGRFLENLQEAINRV